MGIADRLFSAIPGVRRWWWRRKWTSLDVPAEEWAALDGMTEDLNDHLANVRSLEKLIMDASTLRAGHGMNTRTSYRDLKGAEHAVDIVLDGAAAAEKLMEGYHREMDSRRRGMMKLAVEMSNWAVRNAAAIAYEDRTPFPERIAAFVREAKRIAAELNAARKNRTADQFLRYALLDRESRAKRLGIQKPPERVELGKPKREGADPPPKKKRITDSDDEKRRREIARAIPSVFSDFGVYVKFAGFRAACAVTRYKFSMERGQKLSKAAGLEEEIAMRLGVENVSVTRSGKERQTVCVDVPNESVTPLYFRDAPQEDGKIFIGVDIEGEAVFSDMDGLCHVLIAGTTGSGKSTFLHALICSLIRDGPQKSRFMMIDPKVLELTLYEGVPHLWQPVITDSAQAVVALGEAADEMDERCRTLARSGVQKLDDYNRSAESPIPRLIIVIDELADLMATADKSVETSIARIAQKGRAAGIHLVIATQSPRADVITGKIKANLPSRVAFAAASAIESRIILDEAGAEKLLGKGDMLFRPQNGKARRLQGAYIDADEIRKIVSQAKEETS